MGTLFGYMGNEPERLRCVLNPVRPALMVPEVAADGWGIGFFQSGEVLLQRRPKNVVSVDFFELLRELRTDVLIGHVRAPGRLAAKNENTAPYRFRSWLFAASPTTTDFSTVTAAVLDCIPEFLRRNIRGDTHSELIFHLFLSFLRDAGNLSEPELAPGRAADALVETMRLLDQLMASRDRPPLPVALLATNGHFMVALARGRALYSRSVKGVQHCLVCSDPERSGRHSRAVDHEHLRSILFLSGPGEATPEGFMAVDPSQILLVSHDLEVAQVRVP